MALQCIIISYQSNSLLVNHDLLASHSNIFYMWVTRGFLMVTFQKIIHKLCGILLHKGALFSVILLGEGGKEKG